LTDAAFWSQPTAAVLKGLGVADIGLSSSQAAKRLLEYGGKDAILARKKIAPSLWRKIDKTPFDFERRRISVLVEEQGERTLIITGAREDVMRMFTHMECSSSPGR
jgi:magnesium-transporting ATPase (P-type)